MSVPVDEEVRVAFGIVTRIKASGVGDIVAGVCSRCRWSAVLLKGPTKGRGLGDGARAVQPVSLRSGMGLGSCQCRGTSTNTPGALPDRESKQIGWIYTEPSW